MTSEVKQTLKTILHPYLFVLKEGGKIKKDLLDYSLIMLLINSSETIKSPESKLKTLGKVTSIMDINIQAAPIILG